MNKRHSEKEIIDTFKALGIDSEERRKEITKVQNIYKLTAQKPKQFFIKIDTTSKTYEEKDDAGLESDIK